MGNMANKLKQVSKKAVAVSDKHFIFASQSPLWQGCGYVVRRLYPGGAERRAAPVPWREWDWPALHHSEGAGPTASRADEALLQQPTLPWLAGRRKLWSFLFFLFTCVKHCKSSFHLHCALSAAYVSV